MQQPIHVENVSEVHVSLRSSWQSKRQGDPDLVWFSASRVPLETGFLCVSLSFCICRVQVLVFIKENLKISTDIKALAECAKSLEIH